MSPLEDVIEFLRETQANCRVLAQRLEENTTVVEPPPPKSELGIRCFQIAADNWALADALEEACAVLQARVNTRARSRSKRGSTP